MSEPNAKLSVTTSATLLGAMIIVIVAVASYWWLVPATAVPPGAVAQSHPSSERVVAGNSKSDPVLDGVTEARAARDSSTLKAATTGKGMAAKAPRSTFGLRYETLLHQAQAGDNHAAEKLYKSVKSCWAYVILPEHVRSILSMYPNLQNVPKSVLARYGSRLRELHKHMADEPSMCAGLARSDVRTKLYPATLLAAQSDDRSAARCYVIGEFGMPLRSSGGKAHVEEYRKYAMGFIQRGIRAGDWSMVAVMAEAYRPGDETFPWLRVLVQPNAAKMYAYMYLLRTH